LIAQVEANAALRDIDQDCAPLLSAVTDIAIDRSLAQTALRRNARLRCIGANRAELRFL